MECKKCKAKLNEGETFCRKCATSIYVEDFVEIKSERTTNFVNTNKLKSITPSLKTKNNNQYAPQSLDLSNISNKDLINRNQNDVKKAKLSLWGSLGMIILMLLAFVGLIILAISFL